MVATKHKIALSLIIALFISLFVKWILPAPESDLLVYDRFWTLKTHGKEKFDVIFTGDSRVYRGISPLHFEEINPASKAINLGYSSGGFSEDMFDLIKERIDENGEKIVVFGITPFSLTPKALENEQLKSIQKQSKSEVFKHLRINPLISTFNPYAVDYLFFGWDSYRCDHYFEEYMDNGWVKSDKIPHSTAEALASYAKIFENNEVSQEGMKLFFSYLDSIQSEGITVFGFIPPSTIEMEQLEDSLSGFDRGDFIKKFKSTGGHWIDLNTREFNSYDGSHLHYESAIRLSQIIAEKVKGDI